MSATVRLGLVGVIALLAFFAFATTSSTPSAEAVPVQPDCTFDIPLAEFIAQGGGENSVTCTFSIRGEEHTLTVDFTFDLSARPPLSIDGCTLDSEPISAGPCP